MTRALLFAAGLLGASAVDAACQSELRVLADDLAGVRLSASQNQNIAGLILLARRHCWTQNEETAMKLINQARSSAGLKPSTGEFDWENVPLESLEKDTLPK